MKRTIKILATIILVPSGIYLGAFLLLGWLAPRDQKINAYYSSTFYSLRCLLESNHLNKLEVHEGILVFSTKGEPSIQKSAHRGIGFETPNELKSKLAAIPAGTRVQAYIGRRLDRESIGVYHYELREIIVDSEKNGA
jgi:hypothetical protein